MDVSAGQIIVWLIVGGLVGSVVGRLVHHRKKGFGLVGNLVLGTTGALVGGLLFDLLNIDLGLGELKITFEDLVAAFVGSFILLGIMWMVRNR